MGEFLLFLIFQCDYSTTADFCTSTRFETSDRYFYGSGSSYGTQTQHQLACSSQIFDLSKKRIKLGLTLEIWMGDILFAILFELLSRESPDPLATRTMLRVLRASMHVALATQEGQTRKTEFWRGIDQAFGSPTFYLKVHRATPRVGRTHGVGVSFGATAQRLAIRTARGWGHSSRGRGRLAGLASAQGGRKALTDSCCSAPRPTGRIPARL